MATDDVTVVIVAYNNQATIRACIDSLLKFSPRSKVIVVDNCSKDNTRKILKNYGNKLQLIESAENMGFARGNNLALEFVKTEYIVFLNPDSRIKEDVSGKLKMDLEENRQFGLIGAKLISPSGVVQKSVRNFPTISRAFQEYILNRRGAFDFYDPEADTLTEVETVTGACFIIRKNIFEEARMFNEKYFMYFEDIELCRVVRRMGLKVGFDPRVKVEHAMGASGTGLNTPSMARVSEKKYHPLFSYWVLQGIFTYRRILKKITR